MRVPRNIEMFRDRLGPGLRDDVTNLISISYQKFSRVMHSAIE